MKNVLLHYFSGTGNTFHMIKLLGDHLQTKGYAVTYRNMEVATKESEENYQLHIFSYPIYAFGTPSLVIKYIDKLRSGNGCKAVVICTCEEMEGQSLIHVTSKLKRKGYDVFHTDAAIYPSNWTQFMNPIGEEKQKSEFSATDRKISEIADQLIRLEGSRKPCSKFTEVWSWIIYVLFRALGRRILGKTFIADLSCSSCQKCVKHCPVKAIRMKNGYPEWNYRCENCQRCINLCPTRSIQTSPVRLTLLLLLEIAMLFVTNTIGRYFSLTFIAGLLLYFNLFLLITFLTDMILNLLQKATIFRKLFSYSFTRKYNRYMVNEFRKNMDKS